MKDAELILVVDDTPANLDVMSEVLEDAGFEVAIATTGEGALKLMPNIQPSLILLDIMMPGIDGFETCRRFKAAPSTAETPIIFMTALSEVSDRVKGFDLGAVDYITKPFQEQEVLARVHTHLRLRNQSKALEARVSDRTAALMSALEQLKHSQLQLVQREKMSVLGELVAGIAHELNNPIGCLVGNIQPAQDYIGDLFHLISLYEKYYPQPELEIEDERDAIDLDYVRADLPKLLNSMRESVNRICNLSNGLRSFSRADNDQSVICDLHESIDSTILILGHRLKAKPDHPAILVEKNYGDLPLVECFPGSLNQVFMNLLANAIDSIEEANRDRSYQAIAVNPGQITITTQTLEHDRQVLIRIQDNGAGMSSEVRERIFDHLFTTKPIGQGTGIGLSIVRQIVLEKHSGTLNVYSQPGEGATFEISLPIRAGVPAGVC